MSQSILRAFIAMLKPMPSSPMRASIGTVTSSKVMDVVGCAFHPSLRSGLPKLTPGASWHTKLLPWRASCNKTGRNFSTMHLPSSLHFATAKAFTILASAHVALFVFHHADSILKALAHQLLPGSAHIEDGRDSPLFTFWTRKAEMPLGPASPVLAMTRYRSAAPPPLIKALEPEMTYELPASLAVVCSEAASLPLEGSVKQYDASFFIEAS